MLLKEDTCATCRRNCVQMHRKKHDICSFFKIMFGETFDKLLVLPPIFSRKLKSLGETKMTLEDANKRSWDVYLSYVKGTLAFRKGWRNFALDHMIEMGDLLVFCYLGDSRFVVEIYGRTGCPKKFKFDGVNHNRNTEATTNFLPKKRPSQSSNEQSTPKRKFNSSYAFPGPNIDATPKPKNVHVVKEPSVTTRNVPSRGHIPETRPTVAPVAETSDPCPMTGREKDRAKVFPVPEPMVEWSFPEPVMRSSSRSNRDKNIPSGTLVADTAVESCSVINREKKRPKMVPVPETLVDPCSMSNRDKSSPKVVRLAETLAEPCFITTREETMEDDRKCLFDLSVFEMPDKLSTIVKKDETDCLLDFPVYGLPENEAGANSSGGIPLLESGTFENAVTEIADKKTTIDRADVKDYLDMSAFEMPRNEYTNVSNECQILGNLQCQEPDHNQNAENKAGLINFPSCQITESNSKIEASGVGLPIDTIMPLTIIPPETAELSALSGQNLMLNNRKTRSYNQTVGGHAKRASFNGASFSISDQNSGELEGGNMRRVKQELSEFKQDLLGHATKKPVKIEENVNKFVKSEPADWDVNKFVKSEPADRDASSAFAVKVICSDSQDFLELPCALPVPVLLTKSKTKFHQQLVFLQDPLQRLWPVIYHRQYGFQVLGSGWKSYMKANCIGPGDPCELLMKLSEQAV